MTIAHSFRASILAMLVLFGLLAAHPALAQSTRAQLTTQNNSVIAANGVGAISGPVLNTVLNAGIQSYGTLLDAQTWAGIQTFTLNPVFPGMVLNGTTITGVNSSGNIALINGSIVSGNCIKWSATGIQDSGAACGFGTVTNIATTSPITGGPITSTGTIACATCVTSSGGGAITGTAPIAVSAAGVVSITGAAGQVLAGASPAFTATPTLGVAGSTVGTLAFANATTGSITLQPVTGALGSAVLTLPAVTDTVAAIAATQILTNKTISGASNTLTNIGNGSLTNPATTVNGQTCTLGSTCTVTVAISTGVTGLGTGVATALGVNVGSAGAFVTFNGALGTPSSGTLTNATGLPIGGITGLGTGVGTALAANVTGSGGIVLGTTPTIATPVLNGTPTGTGVASAATASTLALRDANGSLTVVNSIEGFLSTATAAGTTTMAVGDAKTQVWTGSSTQTIKLATTGVAAGQCWVIVNNSTGLVTVQSSGANTITILGSLTSGSFCALVATPTTAANWNDQYLGLSVASGKVLGVSNTLTLAGTDATTMTFPATSSTVLTTSNTATITKGFTSTPNSLGNMTNFSLDCTAGNLQFGTNHAAVTITMQTSDCAIDLLVTNDATAGAIAFSGFTVGASTGDALTTTNTNKFIISFIRINGVGTYWTKALQ